MDLKQLSEWEIFLDSINKQSFIPNDILKKSVDANVLFQILEQKKSSNENVTYVSSGSFLSLRYLNDAWFWAQVMQSLPFRTCIELCPGKSIVIDLALAFMNFENLFYKIDYGTWNDAESHHIRKKYIKKLICLDVITQTDQIPKSDLIVMNHAIDDLFMGLWTKKTGKPYFECFGPDHIGYLIESWNDAISEKDCFIRQLEQFFLQLVSKLNVGGTLIIRNYPSSFDTWQKTIDRINDIDHITEHLVNFLSNSATMKRKPVNLIEEVKSTFFVFEKV